MSSTDFIFHIVELIAALSGSYFYLKTSNKLIQPFVWYLWVVVFVETFGMYGFFLLNNYDNEIFISIKNSVWCTNTWLYNIYEIISVILFGIYFRNILDRKLDKTIVEVSVIVYSIFTFAYFIITDRFFIKSIPYNFLLQTFLVFTYVMLYYRQLLKSDDILIFYKSVFFYINSGLMLWFLVISPLFIFDTYLYAVNENFVEFRKTYLFIANLLLYSCYTFGFLYSLQFKKQ